MMLKFVLLVCMLHMVIATPQLLTYRDGKFGVNFGGYHAEAGLGGLLTGNAAHGGLSASAGTPLGQNAGAGLGGSVDGNAGGLLYAGAEASPQVGAGAILGGDTSKGGYGGSVAYSPHKTVASVNQHIFPNRQGNQVNTVTSNPSNGKGASGSSENFYDGIQKIRPPKHQLIKPSYATQVIANANANENANAHSNSNAIPNQGGHAGFSKHVSKRVEQHNFDSSDASPTPNLNVNVGSSVVTSALNIPIGILRSLQESLSGLGVAKQGSFAVNT